VSTHNKHHTAIKSTKEKRAHKRHVCHEPTFYSTRKGVYEGIIKDRDKEGVYGIFFETSEVLAVGEVVTIAISTPGEKEGRKIKGMIARKEPGGYAVQFTPRLNKRV
jgi:hypothetical protein